MKSSFLRSLLKPALFLSLLLIYTPCVLSSSFGASPGRLEIKNALRGSVIEKTFTFSSSTIADPVIYSLTYEGEIAQWITAKDGDQININPKSQRSDKTFIFTIPDDIPNGVYHGRILASYSGSTSGKSSGSSSSISAGVVILVTIHVSGDQKIDFTVIKSSIPDTEESSEAQLILDIRNEGNVGAKPDSVVVEIKERFAEKLLKRITLTNFRNTVPPFSRGEISSSFKPALPPDTYWADILVYSEGHILQKDRISFRVLPDGSLKRNIKFLKLTTPSEVELGLPLKITASVRNAGEITSKCSLKSEVYLSDRKDILLAAPESEEVIVKPQSFKDISIYYTPEIAALHTIEAFIRCDGTDTISRSAMFNVTGKYAHLATPAMAAVLILFIVSIIALRKRLREAYK